MNPADLLVQFCLGGERPILLFIFTAALLQEVYFKLLRRAFNSFGLFNLIQQGIFRIQPVWNDPLVLTAPTLVLRMVNPMVASGSLKRSSNALRPKTKLNLIATST